MSEPKFGMSEFLTILQQEGVSLQSEGVKDIALTPSAALRAIAALKVAQVGVAGGEIWKKTGVRFVPTYDIWNVERSDYSSDGEYVRVSLDIAERQVLKYTVSQNEEYVTLGI